MKNLLLTLSLFLSFSLFSQNWEDLGAWGQFGDSQDMGMAVTDNGVPVVAFIDPGGQVKIFEWVDFSWNQIPHSFIETSENIQLVNHADTLYIGFTSISNNYEVHRWTLGSATFTQLGDLASVNYSTFPNDPFKLDINPDTHLPVLTTITPHCCGGNTENIVYTFDGSNWAQHGPGDFNHWGLPDIYDQDIISSGPYTYVLANQFDMGGAMVAPDNPTYKYSEENSRDFGNPDLGLYRIDEGAPSSWDEVTFNYIDNEPATMCMEGLPGKEPFIAYMTWQNSNEIQMFRPNGISTVDFETPIDGGSQIFDVQVEITNSDSAMVLYTVNPISTHNTHLMLEDGGTFVEIGAPGVTDVDLNETDLELSTYTNKPYVLYYDGTVTGVRVYNQPPSFNSNTPENPVCQDAVDFVVFDEFIFDDPDNDSLGIWVVSNTASILQTSNITVARSVPFDPSVSGNHFSISVTTEAGMTGLVDLDVFCTDGIDTIQTNASFTVNALPSPSIILPSTEFCLNAGTQVLDSYGAPAGGDFFGTGVNSNKLFPDLAGVGTYNLHYVYQDINGCKDTVVQSIDVLDIPVVTNLAVTDANCGQWDGAVDATITGGAMPYDIYWSNGTTPEDITGLSPNMYYINITDFNGCYVMDVATVSANGLTVNGTPTNVTCPGGNNGAIDLNVSGTGPFTYAWSNGEITEDLTGLEAGQYEIFVTDAGGCEAMYAVTITEPDPLLADFTALEATCGVTDGSLTSTITGGTGPYDYQWYDGMATPFGPNANSVSTIGAGNYSVDVTDNAGCMQSFNAVLNSVGGPLIVPMNVQEASCANDGSIDIEINSANGVQDIMWSTGATTEDISSLAPGYYSVQVTDFLGCIGMKGITVNPELPNPTDICVVTVDSITGTNLVVWEKPASTEISHWNLYRESSVAGVFQFVDSIPYTDDSEYNDTIAYPNVRSWRYKLTTVNNCGVESNPSLSHKTIHLTISNGAPGEFDLMWDKYEGFPYSIYHVWRYTSQTGWVEIDQKNFGDEGTSDNPPDVNMINYIIEIVPPSTCTSSSQNKAQDYNSSRSNNTNGGIANLEGAGIDNNAFGLSIYPNPSEGIFTLQFEEYHEYTIEIFDVSGKIIFTNQLKAIKYNVDLSAFSSGVYTIRIQNEQDVVVKQLVLR